MALKLKRGFELLSDHVAMSPQIFLAVSHSFFGSILLKFQKLATSHSVHCALVCGAFHFPSTGKQSSSSGAALHPESITDYPQDRVLLDVHFSSCSVCVYVAAGG